MISRGSGTIPTHRIWLLVVTGGMFVFATMVTTILITYRSTIQDREDQILTQDLPLLINSVEQQLLSQFDKATSGLAVLATRTDWRDLLTRFENDATFFDALSNEWADILSVPTISVADIPRETVYAYWSDEPIRMDRDLERDAWFYETWAVDEPPKTSITFYYDPFVGGHAFYFDHLVADSSGRPLAVVGALLTLDPFAEGVHHGLPPGDIVYILDETGDVVLEVSQAGAVHFSPVFDREGNDADAGDQAITAVPMRYFSDTVFEGRDVAITADSAYATARVNLPIDGITAQIFLSLGQRFATVRGAATQQMWTLLAVFAVLFGGFLLAIGYYTRENDRQTQLVVRGRTKLEDLLSVLTHNLSNDLHTLRRSVGQLSESDVGATYRTSTATSHEIDTTLLDMEQVLHNAIYSSRMTEAPLSTIRNEIPYAAMLSRLEQSCRKVAEAKEQRLELLDYTDSPLITDEDILFHILLNLVGNAMKFSPRGSTILLAAVERTSVIEIVVADQGPGFTSEDQTRLFQKNQRLSARPTDGERSTGLGLFVTRHLAELIGVDLELVYDIPPDVDDDLFPVGLTGAAWSLRVPKGSAYR